MKTSAYHCPVHGRFENIEACCPAIGDRYTRAENGALVMQASMRPGFVYRCDHPSPLVSPEMA